MAREAREARWPDLERTCQRAVPRATCDGGKAEEGKDSLTGRRTFLHGHEVVRPPRPM